MQGLQDRVYHPVDIAAATGGLIDQKTQQSWHARSKWLTPTGVPKAGYPREYGLAHVAEAAIVAAGMRHGSPLSSP